MLLWLRYIRCWESFKLPRDLCGSLSRLKTGPGHLDPATAGTSIRTTNVLSNVDPFDFVRFGNIFYRVGIGMLQAVSKA